MTFIMIGSVFVPSRNSRHRTAALALYRALIKTGKQIPLSNWERYLGHVHPVTHVVRKRFSKNKTYTSSRLVYASMAAGYRFLTLLNKAQQTSSPEHDEVVQQLANLSTAPRPREPAIEREPRKPLLTKISGPNEPPKYISTTRPQPKSALSGERKIPRLTSTAEGVPFLRIKKPQPRVLSRAIGRKNKTFIGRVCKIVEIDEELMPAADSEDKWESLVQKQMRYEGLANQEENEGKFSTYRWSEYLSRVWLETSVEKTWEDWVARGKALHEVVDQERDLAAIEKEQGDEAAAPEKKHMPEIASLEAAHVEPLLDPFVSEWWINTARNAERKYNSNKYLGGGEKGWDASELLAASTQGKGMKKAKQ